MTKTIRYTPSSINSFFKCPYKWKLTYLHKTKGIFVVNDKRDLGDNIHFIISKYYEESGFPDEKYIEPLVKDTFNRYFDTKLKKYQSDAEEMMNNFIKFEKERIKTAGKPIFIEKMLEDEVFRGKIDMFDGINIIDWKTGSNMEIDDDLKRQGKVYEILLNSNNYKGNFNILFIALKNGRTLKLPVVTSTWLYNQTNQMNSIVSSEMYPKCYSPLCDWCEVQLECEFENDKASLWDGMMNLDNLRSPLL
jgi:hypothetical protein